MPPKPRRSRQTSAPRPVGNGNTPAPADRFLARGVRIVHEDDHLLVVDKPTGLITADPNAPAREPGSRTAAQPRTLFDMVKRYIREQTGAARRGTKAYVIHRLDKEASGLLVFAKTEHAFRWLKDDFKAKRPHRIYLAVTEGFIGPPGTTGTRQSLIAEDPSPRKPHRPANKRPTSPSARDDDAKKPAVTHYRVFAAGNNRTLLQVRLETGRKNQIRIHMSELGHPLLGDARFGAKTDPIERLALHAAELGFNHPETGQSLRFVSAAPASFYRAVNARREDLDSSDPFPDLSGAHTTARTTQPAQQQTPLPAAPPISDRDTSWNAVANWYDELLEDRANDHYAETILPGTLRLLDPRPNTRILDVACGQGILCRRLASMGVECIGVDAAPNLISSARQRSTDFGPRTRYEVADARELRKLNLPAASFDAVTCIMALSNIDPLDPVMTGVASLLKPRGVFVLVITHPAFRAIGQTHWGWDDKSKTQYRRVDGYLSNAQKPIQMHPGKAARQERGGETTTWTFHRPMQTYIAALARAGLFISGMEEWISARASDSGPRANEENRARREIPLFLGVRAIKA